ncbi:MAG: hypothetical protein ACYDHN_10110 [Solirubrobacteraceae bacterium]
MPLLAVPFLVAAALLGYVAGYRPLPASSGAAFGARTRTVSVAKVLLEYPAAWRVAAAGSVPGLTLKGRLTLAPGGDSRQGGLIVGELRSGEPLPLPASLLSLLDGTPRAEVVNLIGGQAYSYSGLSVRGYAKALQLFVVPGQGGAYDTALACYGTAGSAELRECGLIVAKASLAGEPQYELAPEAGYAQALGTVLDTLQRERTALRRGLSQHPAQSAATHLASTLAERFSTAVDDLSALTAPKAASAAASALAGALAGSRDAYAALATAISQGSHGGYTVALGRVEAAEASVDTALQRFALLGYSNG